jgi:hypothetical protein
VERPPPAPPAPGGRIDRRPRADPAPRRTGLLPRGCLEPPRGEDADVGIVVPLRLEVAGRELAFFSTISTFGSAVDITLDELMIEAFYPANAATASHLLEGIAAA